MTKEQAIPCLTCPTVTEALKGGYRERVGEAHLAFNGDGTIQFSFTSGEIASHRSGYLTREEVVEQHPDIGAAFMNCGEPVNVVTQREGLARALSVPRITRTCPVASLIIAKLGTRQMNPTNSKAPTK